MFNLVASERDGEDVGGHFPVLVHRKVESVLYHLVFLRAMYQPPSQMVLKLLG